MKVKKYRQHKNCQKLSNYLIDNILSYGDVNVTQKFNQVIIQLKYFKKYKSEISHSICYYKFVLKQNTNKMKLYRNM